jgi:Bacterial SH3 domain
MSIRFFRLGAALALSLAASGAGQAQDIRTERVAFAPGTSGTLIEGSITGREIVDYVVGADAGQILSADLQTSNASAYFNILPAGSEEAIFIGSTSGNVADVPLAAAGDYAIRVYLMRNAARRDETAHYSLAIGVTRDFADGLAGGPDYWQVRGLGGDALNVRSGPGTRYAVVGKLAEGEEARNDGCRMSLDQRWCQVRAIHSGVRGWVAGRFLHEAAPPQAAAVPPGGPVGNGVPFDATGTVPCATAAGQPTRPCPFGVIREGPGNAGVWIALGGGAERHILFEGGVPVAADSTATLGYDKNGDLYLVRVGDERFEIPEGVVYGG